MTSATTPPEARLEPVGFAGRMRNPVIYGWLGTGLIAIALAAVLSSQACSLWGWHCRTLWASLSGGSVTELLWISLGLAGTLATLWLAARLVIVTRLLRDAQAELSAACIQLARAAGAEGKR